MVEKFTFPIMRQEVRSLCIKSFNPDTGYILFELHIPQVVDIKLDITPKEIELLHEASIKLQRQVKEANNE